MPDSRAASGSSPVEYTCLPQAVRVSAKPVTANSTSIKITPVVSWYGPMFT